MTTIEVFKDIEEKFSTIKVSEVTRKSFESFVKNSELLRINPKKYFIQIRRHPDPRYTGLAIECLLVDETRVFDIVVGIDTIDVNIVWLKQLIKVEVLSICNITKVLDKEKEVEKKEYSAELRLVYSQETGFFYNTNIEKIDELFAISSIISNIKSA